MNTPRPMVIARASSVRSACYGSPAGPGLLDRCRERGNNLEEVADDSVIGNLEDRCFLVLVDRDDRPGCAHSREMLDRTRYADCDVQIRTYQSPRLPDLIAVWTPTFVGYHPRCTDSSVTESGCKLFHQMEILGSLESAAAADDYRRLAKVQLRATTQLHFLHHHTRRVRISDRRGALNRARARTLHRREHVRPYRHQRGIGCDLHSREHLADVHRMLHDYRVTVQLDVRNIGYESHAELGRHARCEIASERRRWEDRDAISAGMHALRDNRCNGFRVVLRECSVLGDDHLVRSVLRELRRAMLDTRRTGDERMYLTTGGVGHRTSCRHGL